MDISSILNKDYQSPIGDDHRVPTLQRARPSEVSSSSAPRSSPSYCGNSSPNISSPEAPNMESSLSTSSSNESTTPDTGPISSYYGGKNCADYRSTGVNSNVAPHYHHSLLANKAELLPSVQDTLERLHLDNYSNRDSPMIIVPHTIRGGSPLQKVAGVDMIKQTKKEFPCGECGKAFARRSDLGRHEKIHTGERRNQCDICGKRFIQRSALTVHRRVHTGEKPHACDVCGKTFSDSSSLARHRRIHTGDRPYVCEYPDCDRAFTRRNTLNKHIRTHPGWTQKTNAIPKRSRKQSQLPNLSTLTRPTSKTAVPVTPAAGRSGIRLEPQILQAIPTSYNGYKTCGHGFESGYAYGYSYSHEPKNGRWGDEPQSTGNGTAGPILNQGSYAIDSQPTILGQSYFGNSKPRTVPESSYLKTASMGPVSSFDHDNSYYHQNSISSSPPQHIIPPPPPSSSSILPITHSSVNGPQYNTSPTYRVPSLQTSSRTYLPGLTQSFPQVQVPKPTITGFHRPDRNINTLADTAIREYQK